jgi:hypothetical protein
MCVTFVIYQETLCMFIENEGNTFNSHSSSSSSSSSSSVGPGGSCPQMYLSQCGLLYLPCF